MSEPHLFGQPEDPEPPEYRPETLAYTRKWMALVERGVERVRAFSAWTARYWRWSEHPLLAWLFQLAILVALVGGVIEYEIHWAPMRRDAECIERLALYAVMTWYILYSKRTRATRLKPSPFTFWFQSYGSTEIAQEKLRSLLLSSAKPAESLHPRRNEADR